jgi:hypothetical protein
MFLKDFVGKLKVYEEPKDPRYADLGFKITNWVHTNLCSKTSCEDVIILPYFNYSH